MQDLE